MRRITIINSGFVAMAMLLTLTSCGRRSDVTVKSEALEVAEPLVASADTMNTEMRMSIERGIVLERVKNIYRVVKSDYMSYGGSHDSEWFDKAFCSKSWNKLLMAVRCKEERTGTLFFEINRWSMSLYSGEIVSFDDFEVENLWTLGKQKRATVSFVVYENDIYTPARIDLVYEDNHWVIDNFHNLRYMLDVRSCMWNYLNHDIV